MLKNYYYYKRTISLTLIRKRGEMRRGIKNKEYYSSRTVLLQLKKKFSMYIIVLLITHC